MAKNIKNCLYLLTILQVVFLFTAASLYAEPFGFLGIQSSLQDGYLEDLGISLIRGNIPFKQVYSIPENKWSFQKMDNKFKNVYARNADLVITFVSPINMNKIRADYYRDFIVRTVERYDGDDDYGCIQNPPDCYQVGDNLYPTWAESERPAIKFWQMENEVDADDYWSIHPEDYAELVNLVYPLVKDACPDCSVLLGGFLLLNLQNTFYDTFFMSSNNFDIVDFHWFGEMTRDHFRTFSKRINFLKNHCPFIPIWITETATYTDSPQKENGTYHHYQTELNQAVELFKRYVHFAFLGVEKIMWTFLYEATFGTKNGFFWYTGIVYDGRGEYDKGEGIKKLSYFTYKLMVEKLSNADWVNISSTMVEENVYQYRFMKDATPVYVAWYDWFNGPSPSNNVTLDVSAISTSQARVTEVVPKFQTGKEADTVPFEEAFISYIVPVVDGRIDINLRKKPVCIEEY